MNAIDLKGRRAVVTGAARGIGYATAERIAGSGGSVVIWDSDGEAAGEAAARIGKAATARAVELTSEDEIAAATADALGHGQIDILVNNAGITGGNGKTWDLEPAIWRKTIEVNLVAPYLVCRAIVPHMTRNGYGRVVNVASIAGKEGNPNASHYSASKAGLIALTKSLGKELAGTGVLVNGVTPAAAKTDIFDQMTQEHLDFMLSKIPLGRFVEPAEIAAMIAWLASEECSFSTGAIFDISGGRAVY